MADIAVNVAELVAMLDEEEADEISMKRATAQAEESDGGASSLAPPSLCPVGGGTATPGLYRVTRYGSRQVPVDPTRFSAHVKDETRERA